MLGERSGLFPTKNMVIRPESMPRNPWKSLGSSSIGAIGEQCWRMTPSNVLKEWP